MFKFIKARCLNFSGFKWEVGGTLFQAIITLRDSNPIQHRGVYLPLSSLALSNQSREEQGLVACLVEFIHQISNLFWMAL